MSQDNVVALSSPEGDVYQDSCRKFQAAKISFCWAKNASDGSGFGYTSSTCFQFRIALLQRSGCLLRAASYTAPLRSKIALSRPSCRSFDVTNFRAPCRLLPLYQV